MMSLRRINPRRDGNERPIMEALTAAGCSVQQLSVKGCPDLLVGFIDPFTNEPINLLMEIKGDKGKLTADEAEWIQDWRGQVFIVHSVEEALEIVGRL